MKITKREFLASPKKAITLIGMSGVGKSYISEILSKDGWLNYSVDYLIGAHYLREALGQASGEMSAGNILALSEFVGQLGAAEKGGLDLGEFKKRQSMYCNAEIQAMKDACGAIDGADGNIVVDSSGSICELNAPTVINEVGHRSLFVYLKVRQEGHGEILRRAVEYPKPLYYSPDFLIDRLDAYMEQFDVAGVDMINPNEFLRWVFPFLFQARLEKYQVLADFFGVSVYSDKFADVKSAEDVMAVIAEALE
ncbi:MAG: hypothetical protein KTR28_08070 [Micavibrio sp.]|nr:hypothetical protein [Micavibrio sp.]